MLLRHHSCGSWAATIPSPSRSFVDLLRPLIRSRLVVEDLICLIFGVLQCHCSSIRSVRVSPQQKHLISDKPCERRKTVWNRHYLRIPRCVAYRIVRVREIRQPSGVAKLQVRRSGGSRHVKRISPPFPLAVEDRSREQVSQPLKRYCHRREESIAAVNALLDS